MQQHQTNTTSKSVIPTAIIKKPRAAVASTPRPTTLFKKVPEIVKSRPTAVFKAPTTAIAKPPQSTSLFKAQPPKTSIPSRATYAKPKPKPKPTATTTNDITNLVYTAEQRQRISNQSYIGPFGYTVTKSALIGDELEQIKEDSTITPIVSGFVDNGPPAEKVPLYRENDTKLYLPQHYGYTLFGPAAASSLSPGTPVNKLKFTLLLNPEQQIIVNTVLAHLRTQMKIAHIAGALTQVGCGKGKTIMGIYIAVELLQEIQMPTIIWIEKDFLANQWIERIQFACPGARIGRIQQDVFDVADKHFVLAMVQTVYSRTYPAGTFSSFGLTIIDEAHSLCSSQYFKVLQQVVTPYTLALSARFEKKNGMDTILHRFVGPLAYVGKEEEVTHRVTVRVMKFAHPDEGYNEVETDFKGRVKYSSLISRIAGFEPRIDYIVNIGIEHMKEKPEGQTIILSFTRELLVQIQRKLAAYSDPATGATYSTGFYIGGMKKKELDISEKKQFVLATYSMAAEALDIPTLDSLIFATPKSDILQSLGRIMRIINDNKYVYDVVDSHSVFVNQHRKRNSMYRKNGYLIYSTNSDAYRGEATKWHSVYVPKGQKDKVCASSGNETGKEKKDKVDLSKEGDEKESGKEESDKEESDKEESDKDESDKEEYEVDEDAFDNDPDKPVECMFGDDEDN